jgi:hypothetical protein
MDRRRVRLALAIVGGVLLVSLAAALAAVVLAEPDPAGYGPALEAEVVGFCSRSAPDLSGVATPPTSRAGDDDAEAACRCAYRRLAGTVPWSRFAAIDEELRRSRHPPSELVDAVRACGAPAPTPAAPGSSGRSTPAPTNSP